MKFQTVVLMMISAIALAQVPQNIQLYRNDQKGNIINRAKGTLDGNKVRTFFSNNGEVSDWFNGAVSAPHFEWPKGTGHRHLDGFTFMVGAKVNIVNALGQNVNITPIETSYREEMDIDPLTGMIWGFEPIAGYAADKKVAVSSNPTSWPAQWPDALGLSSDWNGSWYGYFGKGVKDSLVETFFVMDDSQDKEFTQPPWSYYPFSNDSLRGGLGLRVEVRGLQFSTPLLEDIVIWHYNVINISENDYDTTAFGFFFDPSVGSKANDAAFNRTFDITYVWVPDGMGFPDNYKTGYYGQSFLETPSNPFNGIDDDEDGMIDERQDDGIDNDGDWSSLADDVGADGIPSTGDIGEGNGVPTSGEPNFEAMDKDEADQIGLQSAYIGLLSDKTDRGVWPKNDPLMWRVMVGGITDTTIKNANISAVCASGPFPLKKYKQGKIVTAMMCGDDLTDILWNKKAVQYAHNHNYDVTHPPLSVNDDIVDLTTYSLSQNYPNPFNPATTIRFSIPQFQHVKITVFDVLGKEVSVLTDEDYIAGEHSIQFNASYLSNGTLASGVYFYQIHAGSFIAAKKLLLVK